MNPKAFCYVLLIFFLAFTFCKKSDDEIQRPTPKIKTMISYVNNSLSAATSFEYDDAGRLSKQIIGNSYDRFVYSPGKIIKERHFLNQVKTYNDTLFLNNQGLVIAQSGRDITYEYDQVGYQSSIRRGGEKLTYTMSAGNTLTTDEWRYAGATWELIETTNYLFIPNSINTIGSENIGISFYGKQDKNLRSGALFFSHHNLTTLEKTATYEYEFDAQQRVIKSRNTEDPLKFSFSYTYYD